MTQPLHPTPIGTNRRNVLKMFAALGLGWLARLPLLHAADSGEAAGTLDEKTASDWLTRWQRAITGEERNRYCDKEMGEEIGWRVSPCLEAFYWGYRATGDLKWADLLVDWADSWIKRGVKEPDGFTGWPKAGGASTTAVAELYSDSLLGEAMGFKPLVEMAGLARKTPALKQKHGEKLEGYLQLAEQTFAKWIARACWREVETGGVWLAADFGIDQKTDSWTEGYSRRQTEGFTLPDNKQNLIAQWMLALHDVTAKPEYKTIAGRWFNTMKSRMRIRDGKFYVWNYWDPAGPWDYKPNHATRHWVGVHANGGYYAVDVEAIVAAHEHGLTFDGADIERLVATNRDYMWNGQLNDAKFKSIGGGQPDPRWKDTPGLLWESLVPYDPTLRKIFVANHRPDSWGGLASTPKYLALNRKA